MGEGIELPRRRLGKTDIELTVFGVGGDLGLLTDKQASKADGEQAAILAVRRALELGVGYFDTAPSYGGGEAERHLGLGLRELSAAERAGLRVSTKVGTHPEKSQLYDADSIRWSLERSLARLFCDAVDIVYVHDPVEDAHMDQILGPDGALETLQKLREEGVLQAIGLGVRNHRFLRRAIECGHFDAILPSYDFHPLRDSVRPVIGAAVAAGMGVVNGSPYNAGLLAGRDLDEALRKRGAPEGDVTRARALCDWCGERDLDPGEVAMQYSLRHSPITCTLAGPRTVAEVETNIQHAMARLPETLWAELHDFVETLGPAPPGGESD